MKSYQEIITKVCIEANPEIARCFCTRGMLTTQAFTTFRCGLCKKKKSWHNGLSPKWCNECAAKRQVCGHCKTSIFKVRPRTIHLADILFTFNKTQPMYPIVVTQEGYLVGTYRGNMGSCAKPFGFEGWNNVDGQTHGNWNLKQDDLTQQSRECQEFIAKTFKQI